MMIKRYLRLSVGLILFAIGIVFTVNGNLGLAPWDAFHVGLSQTFGITFGQVSIIVGFSVMMINYHLRESIGIGTITNIFVIGIFIDMLFYLNLIPVSSHMISGIVMLIVGMFLIAFASYCYIGSGFGTGPRDGLMVALTRITQKPVGLVRGIIELTVLALGFLLGAKVGIGTLILGFGIGPIVQMTFKILNFKVEEIQHDAFLKKTA